MDLILKEEFFPGVLICQIKAKDCINTNKIEGKIPSFPKVEIPRHGVPGML